MRALYNRLDCVFVLNSEYRDWLTGHKMQLKKEHVFLTAHHTQSRDFGQQKINKASINTGANDDTPVLFIACRIRFSQRMNNIVCRKLHFTLLFK